MVGIQRYVDMRLDEQAKAADRLHAADTLAAAAAKHDLTQRLDGMNEFRRALTDQSATFIPRSEAEGQWRRTSERLDGMAAEHRSFVGRSEHDALAERINSLDVRLTRAEGTDVGSNTRTATLRQTIVVAVAVLGLVMTIVVTLLDHYVSR